MIISILTPTYNRKSLLLKLYESIIKNLKTSNLEAEWIIIDDGSTDGTKSLIESIKKRMKGKSIKENLKEKKSFEEKLIEEKLIEEKSFEEKLIEEKSFEEKLIQEKENQQLQNRFKIKYIYQQNSGKMAAINNGIKQATGELIVDCDSDDFFEENAFTIIEKDAQKLLQDKELYALCYLKQDTNGNISGKRFERNFSKSTMFDLYFKQGIEGEKILVFNAKIRKKYKHELEKNEKFVTEARMYHKMDKNYKILCINEIIETGEYRDDGYTNNIFDTFNKYPNGYYMYFKEILQKGLKGMKLKKKIYVIKHFLYFLFLKNTRKKKSIYFFTKKNRHQ